MPRTKLDTLKRKQVVIRANGITYKGILLEATEDEITLKTQTRFLSIPMNQVVSVDDPKDIQNKLSNNQVDASYYDADLLPPETEKK